jgi:hypothetical protein
MDKLELARSTDEEKQNQLKRLRDFHRRHAGRIAGHAASACSRP